MKEAIRMVLESIYDLEFPDISHFRSGRGCHSALRRIKEEWGTSRWFLEFDIRKCFHTIDRHRLIPIFKEEIGDPKFFYPFQKVFSAGRLEERSNTKMFTPFDNPERQFRTKKNTTPLFVHNIYSFYESESLESEPESEEMSVIDIETLTLEKYLALERGNTIRKERNPEDENFAIKGQFLRELRDNTFAGIRAKMHSST
ncbi:maturase [Tanacetum coccineum]